MKNENIALFKRFLKTEGINTMYAGMYKQSHPKDAPDDVEVFLRQVDAKDAILSAFHFPKDNNDFGVNFWFEKAVKWEKVLASATASQFYGYCWHHKESIAREAEKPLEKFTAYLHPMPNYGEELGGVERALQIPNYSSTPKEYIEALQNDTTPKNETKKLDAWTGKDFKKEEPKLEPVPETPKGVTEEQMALSGFKMFNIKKTTRIKLIEGRISINIKSGHRVCFNQQTSKEIEKAKHPYLHVFSKEGALYFLFDDISEDGLRWRKNENNIVFAHKDLIINIRDFFGIKEQRTELAISKNMAKTPKNLFYKITKI